MRWPIRRLAQPPSTCEQSAANVHVAGTKLASLEHYVENNRDRVINDYGPLASADSDLGILLQGYLSSDCKCSLVVDALQLSLSHGLTKGWPKAYCDVFLHSLRSLPLHQVTYGK
jgi:hypothetical protein